MYLKVNNKLQVKNNIRLGNTTQYNNYQKSKKDKSQQNFKGGVVDTAFNVLDKGFAILDKNPMIQVSFVDTVATNIPRTLVDLKTGLAAALETCRREFSGLFVNCRRILKPLQLRRSTRLCSSLLYWSNQACLPKRRRPTNISIP